MSPQDIYRAVMGGRMSKKDKSQGKASWIGTNLFTRYRSAIAERDSISKKSSDSKESQHPSPSISGVGINADSRLTVINMSRHRSNGSFFPDINFSMLEPDDEI